MTVPDDPVDWAALAGNGRCAPMPETTTEISNAFVGLALGAPDFASYKRAALYPVSLDMVIGVLRAAVQGVGDRCKRDDARTAYRRSVEELDRARQHFYAGEIALGSARTLLARCLFREGALPRSKIAAINEAQSHLQQILRLERDKERAAD